MFGGRVAGRRRLLNFRSLLLVAQPRPGSAHTPDPATLAAEIVEDLEAALAEFSALADSLAEGADVDDGRAVES